MRRTPQSLLFFCSLLLLFLAGCGEKATVTDPVVQELRNRLTASTAYAKILVREDTLCSPEWVRTFYENRQFHPTWSVDKSLLLDADSVLAALNESDLEGLDPRDYHLDAINTALTELKRSYTGREPIAPQLRTDLDLLLTDAYLLFASHLREGKIDRDSLKLRRTIGWKGATYDSLLTGSLESHAMRVGLRALLPRHSMYEGLKEMLASFEVLKKKGGWGSVPAGQTLKGGDSGKRVLALRNRLWVSGDLSHRTGWSTDEFDSTLVDGLRSFQRRHGLEPSGVADSTTIVTLNVPVQKRIEQIKVNLERWRWMPHDLGRKHIRVNIPDFRLVVENEGKQELTMKVVLGLPEWQTPVFSAAMSHVLFNVHWIAPDDILTKELINYMKADSNYLRGNNMTLWRRKGDSLRQIDPRTINIKEMDPKDIDFFLRQEAGPQNIMGQVKFLVPNEHSIYLHDTPYREDFPKNVRMFSHGCIRLEKPLDLAEYILMESPTWNRERIDTVIARKMEQSLLLKHPIPVHVVYCTAWKEKNGIVHFREDYYGLDRRLGAALLGRK
ncbi:MAG: L,D-transpeptidase family protein [Ignavibacteriales bacterium]|nr:L,D-transpeptidase family protein [Ignavibacteriales bacterium]